MIIIDILIFLPWPIRRAIYNKLMGHNIADTARIGFSLVRCRSIQMSAFSKIGHLNRISGLRALKLGEYASIGHLNWVSGMAEPHDLRFAQDSGRISNLSIGAHAAITHRHMIDCTDEISVGTYTTITGWRSQILTHGIDIAESRQKAAPVSIGAYCFVGTGVIFLKGAILPDNCILGADSVLTRAYDATYNIFFGNPATPVKSLSQDAKYFKRVAGFVF